MDNTCKYAQKSDRLKGELLDGYEHTTSFLQADKKRATEMNVGYPLEWFVEPMDDYLLCGVCGKVMHSPCATSCGHAFCRGCLCSWIEYYGICPNRCGEVELIEVRAAHHIEKRISGLLTRCKYNQTGCSEHITLADKYKHEKSCPYRVAPIGSSKLTKSQSLFSKDGAECRSCRRTRSTASTIKTTKNLASPTTRPQRVSQAMQTQHTFRLKRTRTREPLGLVLLSGEKTTDGRPYNFFVKKVNPDTLAWKAGVQSGDMIVQVDFHDLSRMNPQEAVARIKDKTLVTLTVIRNSNTQQMEYNFSSIPEEHIYDEILYTDSLSQNLSQQDENFPPFATKESSSSRKHGRRRQRKDGQNRPSKLALKRSTSPVANLAFLRPTPGNQGSPHSGEKGSKDSGLSSGSSGSKHQEEEQQQQQQEQQGEVPMDRSHAGRLSYRTEQEMAKNFLKTQQKYQESAVLVPSSRNCRIEGEYEVEEIYLQKNGTSQLGVTLGYDTKSTIGHLYVCEVLPTGLAAEDGRLHCGDVIKRVNGFEVYDPEEAILLFLEQDQDITLTVARKMKPAITQVMAPTQPPQQPAIEHDYAVLEAKAGYNHHIRRIDSCGTLDSHTTTRQNGNDQHHHHPTAGSAATLVAQNDMLVVKRHSDIDEDGYEFMCRNRSSSSPGKGNPRKSLSPPMRNTSPNMRTTSPLCANDTYSSLSSSHSHLSPPPPHPHTMSGAMHTDHSFKPIPLTKTRTRTSTGDIRPQQANSQAFHRSSSATPDIRGLCAPLLLASPEVEREIKIMVPPASSLRKITPTCRTMATEFQKLPNRSDSGHLSYNQTESLV